MRRQTDFGEEVDEEVFDRRPFPGAGAAFFEFAEERGERRNAGVVLQRFGAFFEVCFEVAVDVVDTSPWRHGENTACKMLVLTLDTSITQEPFTVRSVKGAESRTSKLGMAELLMPDCTGVDFLLQPLYWHERAVFVQRSAFR